MTGLIYVGIIAVWAIVLVPAWLRRHDHRDPERSVNRFTRSLEELSRRDSVLGIRLAAPESEQVASGDPAEAAPDVQRVQRPPRQVNAHRVPMPAVPRGSKKVDGSGARPVSARSADARTTAARRAAARRRVVLGFLSAALLVVAGLVVAGVLLPIALVAPATLLAGFAVVARVQVRSAKRRRTSVARNGAARVPVVERAQANVAATGSGNTWEARPATLPTYVTAPPAAEFPRVIDTATPGAWTAAAMLERAQQQKDRSERMAAARAEAIARAQAEQAAAEARSRDEQFLAQQASAWEAQNPTAPQYRPRVVNE